MRVAARLAVLGLLAVLGVRQSPAQGAVAASVVPIDTAGFRAIREESRGAPLLVNFWATWCVPCVEEFPDIVRLRETYGPRGLRVVFISIDRQADAGTVVARFLRMKHIGFDTYIKKAGNDEGFIDAVDLAWSGALPATFIYDARGKLKHRLVDRQTFDGLSRLMEPLLHR